MNRLGPVLAAFAVVLLMLAAGDAQASCYRCRDSLCWMAEGTGAECHYVGSGCATSGNCNDPNGGGMFCGTYPEPDCQGYAAPLVEQWQLAQVRIQTAKPAADQRLAAAFVPACPSLR